VAYSPDGQRLYDSTGDSGAVDVLSTSDWKRKSRIELNGPSEGKNYRDSFSASLASSHDGRYLYVIDQANWRLVVETNTERTIASVPTGVNPVALCLSPDGKRLYVVNSGLFEYKTIEGADPEDLLRTGLRFPPFGYPSKQAEIGVRAEAHSVPGLGDSNNQRSSSLWTYDVSDPHRVRVGGRLRLGNPIKPRAGVVGGAAPSAVAAGGHTVYVALSHDDAIAVVSEDGCTMEAQIALRPFSGAEF
jgi:YVTN family beta-propeller protein